MFYRHKDPRFAGEAGQSAIWGENGLSLKVIS
jgi:hypothetical protein